MNRWYVVSGFSRTNNAIAFAVAVVASVALAAQEHSYTPADIENGSRLFQSTCAGCHGQNGDGVAGIDLSRGQFRRGTSDTEIIKIIQTGIPGTTMPPHNLSDSQAGTVVAYLRNMATIRRGASPDVLRGVGDAGRGKALFEGKGQCATCHRVNGKGPRLAPDLSEVGATRPLPELHQALLDPDATIRPGNRFFQVVTKDGARISGRLMNQDSFSVQLIDANERLVSLPKSNLREYGFVKSSPMPSVRDKLSLQEVDDLVGYLVTLKGFTQ
jgi:putative heme-binding domain-containing protein